MSSNPNDPAFPPNGSYALFGLTKRELFAAMALQGLLSGGVADPHRRPSPSYDLCPANTTRDAVVFADALLLQLNFPPEQVEPPKESGMKGE